MHRSRAVAGTALLALTATSLYATSPQALASGTCDQLTQPVYQSVNGSTATSLVTQWKHEYGRVDQLGFTQRGEFALASAAAGTGTVPVHRFYRNGDFVTAPEADVATWTGRGYADQGVAFHAAPAGAACGVAVHRVVNAKGFHEEALEPDVAGLVAAGWVDVGTKYRLAAVANPSPTPPTPDSDGRFGLAVIPDVQEEVLSSTTPSLPARNKWLVANRDNLDLRAVVQVGDITNWDTPDHYQYVNAAAGMKVLEDAGIPWVGAVGNHDAMATGTGGSARPGVNVHDALRQTTTYNTYFDASHFKLRTATEGGLEDNSVHRFTAAGAKWMVLVLEVWPRADKLAWAKQQIADNPDTNVMIVTHDYLSWSGTVSGGNDGYGDLSPQQVHDQLVAPFANVKLVFSGHEGLGSVKVEDVNGHRVVAMQQNYDNRSDNLLRMLDIDVTNNRLTYNYKSVSTPRVVTPDTVVDGMNWIR